MVGHGWGQSGAPSRGRWRRGFQWGVISRGPPPGNHRGERRLGQTGAGHFQDSPVGEKVGAGWGQGGPPSRGRWRRDLGCGGGQHGATPWEPSGGGAPPKLQECRPVGEKVWAGHRGHPSPGGLPPAYRPVGAGSDGVLPRTIIYIYISRHRR